MGLDGINQFFKEVREHQKTPADVIKYDRWIKELKDPARKNLLAIFKNPSQLTDDQITNLYNEIQRIQPIVESDQSYKMTSLRDKGLYKSICRMFSNLFQNRTSSKKVLHALLKQKNLSVNNSTSVESVDSIIPDSQIKLLDKNLFKIVSGLPTREIERFEYLDQITSLVGQGPITLLYEKNGGLFLGIKLLATHTASTNSSQEAPFTFDMLIRLDGVMKIWTTSKTAEGCISGFNSASHRKKENFTNQLKDTFLQHDRHDDPEMINKKHHYDIRWLITRLSNGDSTLIRHVPESVVWAEVSSPEFKNYGYWTLSFNIDV